MNKYQFPISAYLLALELGMAIDEYLTNSIDTDGSRFRFSPIGDIDGSWTQKRITEDTFASW